MPCVSARSLAAAALESLQRAEIDQRLRDVHARVEHVEGTDDRIRSGEAVGLEVDDLPRSADGRAHVRQQVGERAPPRAVRRVDRFLLQQQSEVVLERTRHGVLQRQRDRRRRRLALRHAAEEGTGALPGGWSDCASAGPADADAMTAAASRILFTFIVSSSSVGRQPPRGRARSRPGPRGTRRPLNVPRRRGCRAS